MLNEHEIVIDDIISKIKNDSEFNIIEYIFEILNSKDENISPNKRDSYLTVASFFYHKKRA